MANKNTQPRIYTTIAKNDCRVLIVATSHFNAKKLWLEKCGRYGSYLQCTGEITKLPLGTIIREKTPLPSLDELLA